jgi:signal transduction histidine kinase
MPVALTLRLSWFRSRVLAAIALGLLPLVLLAAANLSRQVQQGEERVTEDRVALARAAALTVSGFVDTSFATLKALAVTPTLADANPRPALTNLLRQARSTDASLAVLGLFRADGWNVALAGIDQPPLTLNVLDRQYVQEARSTGQPVVSPATIPRNSGVLTVDLVIPIDFTNGSRGALSGSLALTALGDQLRALAGSDTVQIIVVDADGQVVLHPDPNVVRSVTSLKGRPEVDAALSGETGSRRAIEEGGQDDLIAFAPVPTYGWGVLVVQPASTAFALVQRDLLLATGLLLLILLLVGAIVWLFGGRLQHAYAQVLDAKTHAEAAQAQAEAAQQRLAFLAEASRMVGASLEDQTTLDQVASLAVPTLGDMCAIELRDEHLHDGASVLNLGRKHELQPSTLLRHLGAEAMSSGHVVKQETRNGRSVAGVAFPLLAGGRVLGAIACVRLEGQSYDDAEVSLGTEFAQRVALAMENVALYRASQRAIEERDEFLSVAAHELKTPVTSLRGYAQLALRRMSDGSASNGGMRKPLQVIEMQSGKLTRLIGQLLDVSRLDAGRLTLTRERVDLVGVLKGLAERTRMLSDLHMIVLDAPPAMDANVDAVRIEQVLTNLIDNAVKYSPEGGEVRLSLVGVDDNGVRIAIQDQGVGIPLERREHIFERFYQAHAGLLPAMAGMGLGLYISRQIIELHKGTLEAEYPSEGGVRFVITLPIDE